MKIGDLVQVKECEKIGTLSYMECSCFFCSGNSNRVGLVLGPATRNAFHVMFDTGMWRLDSFDEARGDVKVIRESR